jgi:phosphatidylglycerol---prolipoprotein diacylglyceryl transferase
MRMVRVPGIEIPLGPIAISIHFLFESLAYTAGFLIYRWQRREQGDVIRGPERNAVIVAAILGAAIGSKLLAWLEDPAWTLQSPVAGLLGGKTIVGGLLGGTMAVEWVKKRLGIATRTGDLFAIPLALAIAIGRLGCFFGGLSDGTYGSPANLPWAVDFGDGIGRHPVQIYEILFLAALTAALAFLQRRSISNGQLYRVFLVSYLAWRLAIDFLKPEPKFAALSSIQWACAAALIWYCRDTARMFSIPRKSYAHG